MSIMVFSQCQLASLPMFANRQYSTFVRERAKSIQLWPTYNHVRLSFIKCKNLIYIKKYIRF